MQSERVLDHVYILLYSFPDSLNKNAQAGLDKITIFIPLCPPP